MDNNHRTLIGKGRVIRLLQAVFNK